MSEFPSGKSGRGPRGARGGNEQFFDKFGESKGLRGGWAACDARRAVTAKPWRSRSDQRGYFLYVAQGNLQPDDEIAKKCRFRTGTRVAMRRSLACGELSAVVFDDIAAGQGLQAAFGLNHQVAGGIDALIGS